MTSKRRKVLAGALVVGNEILIGKTRDTNTLFLAEELMKRGIKLSRWAIVPDEMGMIGTELKRFIDDGFELVVVSGGMGPTHDDITVDAVAHGLGLPLVFHKELYRRMLEKWRRRNPDSEMPESAKRGLDKIAYVPQDFDLVNNENGMVEGLVGSVNKGETIVFILPGVPREYKGIIMTRKFQDYLPLGRSSDMTIMEVLYRGNESRIASFLEDLQEEHPEVDIGSYPQGPMRVIVRVTGDQEEVERVIPLIRERAKELEG